jgi:FkbM family methyltransferase
MSAVESFSQHGQDRFILENFFANRCDGVFIDVGAYDGITFSNTLLFERRGWSGICIEPVPLVFEKLRAARSVLCLNCAVSDSDGVAPFIDVDMPNFGKMYSGLKADYDPRHAHLVQTHATASRTIEVPAHRLDGILDEHKIRKVDYLSLDTEGSELKILKSTDLAVYDISVISVENNYNDGRIHGYLARYGYRLVHTFAGFDELYAK